MTPIFRRFMTGLVIFAVSVWGAGASASLTIADLAPRKSIVLIGIDDYAALHDSFVKTPINDLLHEPDMRRWLVDSLAKVGFQFGDLLDQQWINGRPLPQPTGMVGLAAWADPKTASPVIMHYLLAAEMGEHADDFGELINSTLDQAVQNKHIRVTDINVEGETMRRVELLDLEKIEFGIVMLRTPFDLYLAQRDDLFFICSDKDELRNALKRAAGADIPAVRDREELQLSLAPIAPTQVHLTVFAEPLIDLAQQLQLSDNGKKVTDGVTSPLRPVLESMGLASIRAISYGWQFDTPIAMLESRGMVLARNLDGLLGLFDIEADGFSPPVFVGAGAAEVRLTRGDFTKIIPLVNNILNSLADKERLQIQAFADLFTAVVGPIVSTLGPSTTFVRTFDRPFDAKSENTLFAIQLNNEHVLTTTLSRFGRLLGIKNKSRDGEQLWESSGGQAIGVGDNHLLLGSTASVRQSLNHTTTLGTRPLMDAPRFRNAIALHQTGGFYYAYLDLPAVLEFKHWKNENWERLLREKYRKLGYSDAQIDEYVNRTRKIRDRKIYNSLPAPDVLLPHVGDFVDEAHVVPNGLFYHGLWLAPRSSKGDRASVPVSD